VPKLRVHKFAISLNGCGAGPNQHFDNPLGAGGLALHERIFPPRTFHQMTGEDGAKAEWTMTSWLAVLSTSARGARRHMFGPIQWAWLSPPGSGEHLFSGLEPRALGYDFTEHVDTTKVTHFVLTKILQLTGAKS
jgi:hypothetical protein